MVIKFSRLKEIKIWTVSCGGLGCVHQDLKYEPSWEQWSHLPKKSFTFTSKSLKTKIICSTPRLQLLMMYFVLHSEEWGALCRRPEWRNIGQFRMMYRQAIFLQMSVLVFAMVCNGAHLICKNQIVGRNFRIGAHLISSNWISVKFSIKIFWVKD